MPFIPPALEQNTWNLRRVGATLGWVVVALAAFWGLTLAEVARRARGALREGDRYMAWHREPDTWKIHWETWRRERLAELDAKHEAGSMDALELERWRAAVESDVEFRLSESPLKYAVQWYRDAQLFQPPRTRWVREAAQKEQEALGQWDVELRGRGITVDPLKVG